MIKDGIWRVIASIETRRARSCWLTKQTENSKKLTNCLFVWFHSCVCTEWQCSCDWFFEYTCIFESFSILCCLGSNDGNISIFVESSGQLFARFPGKLLFVFLALLINFSLSNSTSRLDQCACVQQRFEDVGLCFYRQQHHRLAGQYFHEFN